jgi:hypothetical protein
MAEHGHYGGRPGQTRQGIYVCSLSGTFLASVVRDRHVALPWPPISRPCRLLEFRHGERMADGEDHRAVEPGLEGAPSHAYEMM